MKTKKTILNIIILIIIMVVVSGCTKEEVSVENLDKIDVDSTQAPEEVINYLPDGEIDTSDWKTYRNDYYGMEIKYPPFLNTASKSGANSFSFVSQSDWNHRLFFWRVLFIYE